MTVYKVTGERAYRGHQPGVIFEANLDPATEQRAVNRNNILVIERTNPGLQPGSWTLPRDWANTEREVQDDG